MLSKLQHQMVAAVVNEPSGVQASSFSGVDLQVACATMHDLGQRGWFKAEALINGHDGRYGDVFAYQPSPQAVLLIRG